MNENIFKLIKVYPAPGQHPQTTDPRVIAEIEVNGAPAVKVGLRTDSKTRWSEEFVIRLYGGWGDQLPGTLTKGAAEKLGISAMNRVPGLAAAARACINEMRAAKWLPDTPPTPLMHDMINSTYNGAKQLVFEFQDLTIMGETYNGGTCYEMKADGEFAVTVKYGNFGYWREETPDKNFKGNRSNHSILKSAEKELAKYLLPLAKLVWERDLAKRREIRIKELTEAIKRTTDDIANYNHSIATANESLAAFDAELANLRDSK